MSLIYQAWNMSDDWEIEDLGIQEVEVFDIETENHTFFANNILVHNSGYFELNQLVNKFIPNADVNKRIEFLDATCKRIETHCLDPLYNKVAHDLNAANNSIRMKRESICAGYGSQGGCGLYVAAKNYYLLVDDSEGFRYKIPKEKKAGLHSKKRVCPQILKKAFDECLYILTTEGVDKVRHYVEEIKKEFYTYDLTKIAKPYSVSDVKRYMDPKTELALDGKWIDPVTGKQRSGKVPMHCRASINFNYVLKKLNLENRYETIKDGSRIKMLFLKPGNPYRFDVIAYIDTFPEELGLHEFIDWEELWKKTFYDPLNDIAEACLKTSLEQKGSIDDWFE